MEKQLYHVQEVPLDCVHLIIPYQPEKGLPNWAAEEISNLTAMDLDVSQVPSKAVATTV